jgi:hypothetical protein
MIQKLKNICGRLINFRGKNVIPFFIIPFFITPYPGGLSFKVSLGEKVSETPISANKPSVIVCLWFQL